MLSATTCPGTCTTTICDVKQSADSREEGLAAMEQGEEEGTCGRTSHGKGTSCFRSA